MLNSAWSLNFRKSPVMGILFNEPVKKAVHFRIQEELFSHIPRIARDLWIQPPIKHLGRRGRDCSVELKFQGLFGVRHYFFSFFFLFLKYCSNWSRRSFQNRSYSCIHPATSRSGPPRKEIRTSRPCFWRSMSPARSSTLRCLVVAFRAVSNGFAISRNRAGPLASCPIIARRVG